MADFKEYTEHLQKTLAPNNDSPKRITELDFDILGSKETRKMSTVTVTKSDFYESTAESPPMPGGVLDLRLGSTGSSQICLTCKNTNLLCPGHFGSIELLFPVFNPGYFTHILHVLRCICKTCSHILLPKNEINKRLKSFWRPGTLGVYTRLDKMSALVKECQKTSICPHCGAINGPIRKTKNYLIVWHKIGDRNEVLRSSFTEQFQKLKISELTPEQVTKYVCEDLTPTRVLHLFDNIPAREIPLLTYSKKISHPSDMIVRSFIVPPNGIRPSVISPGEGSTEDDLTMRVREAIDYTIQFRKASETGDTSRNFASKWNFVQQTLNGMINSQLPDTSIKKNKKDKAVIGFAQRLKGKRGRFRINLSGKRVNFGGRSVISPDPNSNVDQVTVPLEMAKILTFPVVVNKFNIKMLRECIKNGPNKYPGANYVSLLERPARISLRFAQSQLVKNCIRDLKYGDIVERHLINDDVVLFNRQPSLHRISIMAFRAKIMPWRTLRFNVCACSPFNADFDGDEMNLHLPQTLEAAADAKVLMNILSNLFSPRSGDLIVAPTQDFLSGAYLITRKNCFFNYDQFSFLACQIFDSLEELEIPIPAIIAPVPLWTGKQLISLMIKPNSKEDFSFTHEVKNKEYEKDLHMDLNDGYVSFLDSEMISGVLEKSLIGGGGKSLFAVLARDVSPQYAARCMARIAKLTTRFMMNRGFSIGITDVTPNEELERGKNEEIEKAFNKCNEDIQKLAENKFDAIPGMTAEDSLELQINNTLSQVRNSIGDICLKGLSKLNTALVMAKSGAKGSNINISQMTACVGQQIISGQRVIVDFIDRTIPHFHHKSIDPIAKGFVANSFFSGLEPYEFFFHTMSGREGLVDAAVKTAETGYLQRRLMKFMEDATVQYDGTVRMADGAIVQFLYGGDGLDPLSMEDRDYPIKLERVSYKLMEKNRYTEILTPLEAKELLSTVLKDEKEKAKEEPIKPFYVPSFLLDTFEKFVHGVIQKYSDIIASFKKEGALTEADMNSQITASRSLAEFWEMLEEEKGMLAKGEELERRDKELEEMTKELKARKKEARSSRRKHGSELKDIKQKQAEIKELKEQLDFEKMDYLNQRIVIVDKIEKFIVDNISERLRLLMPITKGYIIEFTNVTIRRLQKSLIEPGTTVGALAGQSIGEPATQMTLRSFHFAGVASMNVTLGVPRIQEVMNAVKTIKTPVVVAPLENKTDPIAAIAMKGVIDKVTLGQITKYIKEVQSYEGCYIEILLDFKLINEAQLKISAYTVMMSIASEKKLGVKQENIKSIGNDIIQISFRDKSPEALAFVLQQLLLQLPSVPVSGLDGVHRVIISKNVLSIETNNFLGVLTTPGIDWMHTNSNHVYDVEKVLGIEAARQVIVSEILSVYDNYSLSIDNRHLQLIADTMTMKGRTNGINRHGLAKTCSSSLKLASFEVTMEHLYNAGFHQIQDQANDISSSVILGSFAKIGSGMCDILIAKDLIDEPVLTPPIGFLTPQQPSEIREKIKNGTYEMPPPKVSTFRNF